MIVVRSLPNDDLGAADREAMRALFDAAWPAGDFTDDDWDHAMGGRHWLLERGGRIVSHASVVERELHVGDRSLRTGYLEAVATTPVQQGHGFGTRVIREASASILGHFELGALSTGSPTLYERLGWRRWQGPTFMRTEAGPVRTEDEDGGILVLLTPGSSDLDLSSPISCDWRAGDAW